jgi:structural maintenance of chromosome 2
VSLLLPPRFFINLTFFYRLKTHFKNSQFIIVSLKEGMFNNANVLFRTKFIDGVSAVQRTTPGVAGKAAAGGGAAVGGRS